VAKNKAVRIIVGGAGGQGILTLGKVISYAAINQNMQVSCLPAYGAEMRGGYVYCTIVISSGENIFSPVISKADIAVFMDEQMFKMLHSYIKKDADLILNTSLIKKPDSIMNCRITDIPASEIAEKIGSIKIANMIVTGVIGHIINEKYGKFTVSDLYYGVGKVIKSSELSEMSKTGIETGWNLLHGKNDKDRKD
jgi:2-oxoglutarate ferredoxin oxidoreductase subunit gamma